MYKSLIPLVIIIVVVKLLKNKLDGIELNNKSKADNLDVYKKTNILYPNEIPYYEILKEEFTNEEESVLIKVKANSLLKTDSADPNHTKYRNKIQHRYIDFLICEGKSLEPVIAIQIMNKYKDKEKEEELKRILQYVGISVIHVNSIKDLNIGYIRGLI